MNKQRLIDANAFEAYDCKTDGCAYEGEEFFAYVSGMQRVLEEIDSATTVDPESLPIVQELHKKIKSLEEFCKTSKRSIRRLILARNNAIAELEKAKDESDDLKLRIETACQLCQKLSNGNNTIPMCKNGQCCPLNMEV